MRNDLPSCFETTPIVYAVGENYQIMVPVLAETLMWAEVGGKRYYDDVNGILRSHCTTHRMTVPMNVLDEAGAYKVCYRIVRERKPYRSDVEDAREYQSVFRPVRGDSVRFYHIADAHNAVDKPVASAKTFGKIDFLILNGDLPNHSGDIANFATIHKIAAEITNGEIPVVFSRGNHDMRGIYAEHIAEHTPTDHGRSYYTFRLGDLWGMVLDCGEDKTDDHPEYAHTVCCADFRRRQTEWIEQIVDSAEREYQASGVRKRMVVCHVPFTQTFSKPFDIETETYAAWTRLLREHVHPQLILCGHTHRAYVSRVGSARDAWGQPCPVVVGASPRPMIESDAEIALEEGVYIGAGFEWSGEECTVQFCGSDGVSHYAERL